MIRNVLLLAFLCMTSYLNAQANLFTRQYLDPGQTSDAVTHIVTSDGGMLLCSAEHPDTGTTHSIVLIKTDANGTMMWSKKFATVNPGFRNIVESPDGSYFLCFCQFPYGYFYEAIRLDQNGNILFDKIIPLPANFKVNWMVSSIARSDSGYYVGCSVTDTSSNMYHWMLMRLTAGGNIIWSSTYNSDYFLGALNGLSQCTNGDILMLGSAYNTAQQCYVGLITRISAGGSFLWNERFGYAAHDLYPVDAQPQGNSCIVTVQDYQQSAGVAAIDFVQVDSAGNINWGMRYTGGNNSLLPYDFLSTGTNEYMVVALQSGPVLGSVFLKVDGSGQYISSRFYEGYTISSIESLNNWQYSLAGTMDSLNEHYPVIKTTDVNGVGCDDSTAVFGLGPVFFSTTTGGTTASSALNTVPGNLVAAATGVVVTDRCVITSVNDDRPASDKPDVTVVSGMITIHATSAMDEILLYDMQGQLVQRMSDQSSDAVLQTTGLAHGIYVVCVRTQSGTEYSKIAL